MMDKIINWLLGIGAAALAGLFFFLKVRGDRAEVKSVVATRKLKDAEVDRAVDHMSRTELLDSFNKDYGDSSGKPKS